MLDNWVRINLNRWIKNDKLATKEAEKNPIHKLYRYGYYICWKYYECLWYMYFLCDEEDWLEGVQEEIGEVIEWYREDVKENWYWEKRMFDWEWLAWICKQFERLLE